MSALGVTPAPGRRARHKAELRQRLLRAALELFARQGFFPTTIEQITEAADVAKGTFFNYFPRKEAVFGSLSEIWMADVERDVGEILTKGGPAWKKMLDVFVACAGYYEEDRELSKHMVVEWTRGMHDPDNEVCGRWDELGLHVVRQLQAKGELRRDLDAARAHQVLSDVYHSTIVMWLEAPRPPFPLKDELRKRLTLVMNGLAPRS